MAGTYDKVKNLPFDPRMALEIQASPRMAAEQGSGFCGRWGGASNYVAISKIPAEQRVALAAIQDGYAGEAEIAASTGLTNAEVKTAVAGLKSRGLVKESQVGALESEGMLL